VAEYLPKFLDGDRPKVTLTANVTGGQLVNFNGTPTTAADPLWFGFASRDAKSGETITVFRDGIQRPTAGGAIAQGDPLKAGAAGTVVKWTNGTDAPNLYLGRAMAAAANGDQFDADCV
jgi:hypothetical protein